MKRIYLLFTLLIWFNTALVAQSIEGKIIDDKKKPIENAYIFQKNSSTHAHSDIHGEFFANLNIGDTLYASHINYEDNFVVISDFENSAFIILQDKPIALEEVILHPKVNALNLFSDIDIEMTPVNSSQDILQKVPGLFIGQHAGGGKAEQIFLRGFDLDHGTDINISVDGMPVNMVSHAHGQGYADLHFVIPETIKRIDFGKGPYNANKGNFATAGFVNYETIDLFDQNSVQLELGQFNTLRLVGLFNIIDKPNRNAFLATEYRLTDGPFESPQNFSRYNIMGKFSEYLDNLDHFSVSLSHFTSKWDASGQIPMRAVNDGSISRFGAIDDTEGGFTSRSNILVDYKKYIDNNTFIKNSVFYSLYDFELYSNFTFFLNDPVNGDEIRQKENRQLFGMNSEFNKEFSINSNKGLLQVGLGYRNDIIKDIELSHTFGRFNTIENKKLGNITESNISSYVNTEFNFAKWTFNPALRFDYFKFQYNDQLANTYQSDVENQGILSPKLNILYNYSSDLQFYLNSGKGFHSNDSRVVIEENGKKTLPAAYGSDLGFIWKPIPKLLINSALWYLFSEQEFVYVGDEGVVEPSGKSERKGIDFGLRYQFLDYFYFNTDWNYSHARSVDEPKGKNYIPLAPDFTITGGLSFMHPSGFYGHTKIRHINDRPANEDNSIIAKGYTVADLNAGFRFQSFNIELIIENLLDTEWEETQFATESRLFNEMQSVEEIHFTPGTPFQMRIRLMYNF
jgi:outer membrane receptor protein involved in Fe transport